MARGDRKCVLCDSNYSYCPNCGDKIKSGETWRFMYCSENCRNIFDILSAKAFGHMSVQEAAEKLEKQDLSRKSSFRNDFVKQIDDIFAIAKQDRELKEKPDRKFEKKKTKKIVNEETPIEY